MTWIRSGSLRGSIYWVLLVSGWFAVSKTIIPEAQEHFLTPSARRDNHPFGGLGLRLRQYPLNRPTRARMSRRELQLPSTIDSYLVRIQEMADPSGIYSYRGQRNAEWPIQSGATRRLVQEYGDSILTDPGFPELYISYHRETLLETARARGYDVDSGRRLSDLELLAKLQHLGAPTGLLDFSWSPLVALWFACIDPDNDGKLFMVNTNDAVSVIRLDNDLVPLPGRFVRI